MDSIPTEFSWHLNYPESIETPRSQLYSNCWAHSLAATIGDNFSISNNLKSVYPSSLWITSLYADSCRYDKSLGEIGCLNFVGINHGYNEYSAARFMLSKNYFTKLESCYPELRTFNKILKYLYLNNKKDQKDKYTDWENFKKGNDIEFEYLDKFFTDNNLVCCEKNFDLNGIYKLYCEIKGGLDKTKKLEYLEFLRQNIKFEISHLSQFKYSLKYKKDYTSRDIYAIQRSIKAYILCYGPTMCTILATKEYQNFFYKKPKENEENEKTSRKRKIIPIFQQTEKVLDKEDYIRSSEGSLAHAINILGWGNDDGQEYWWIRDSNSGNFSGDYYKIAFSRFDNKDQWIGPDIYWKEDSTLGTIPRMNYMTLLTVENLNNLDDLLENKIFEKCEEM